MSQIAITGAATGTATFTIESPATSTNRTLTIPDATTTIVGTDATQTLTNKSIVATQLTGTVAAARLPAGSVLQVVSTAKTDTFTTSSTSDVAITGLSASITPSSASSKILILANIGASGCTSNDHAVYFSLYKSASVISGAVGSAAGSRKVCTSASRTSSAARYQSTGMMFLDSPSSTSALTYAVFCSMENGGSTACINRAATDTDSAAFPRTISSITVMEIAA